MKIGEYEQMMSWLTRPETPTPIEPRENFSGGSSRLNETKLSEPYLFEYTTPSGEKRYQAKIGGSGFSNAIRRAFPYSKEGKQEALDTIEAFLSNPENKKQEGIQKVNNPPDPKKPWKYKTYNAGTNYFSSKEEAEAFKQKRLDDRTFKQTKLPTTDFDKIVDRIKKGETLDVIAKDYDLKDASRIRRLLLDNKTSYSELTPNTSYLKDLDLQKKFIDNYKKLSIKNLSSKLFPEDTPKLAQQKYDTLRDFLKKTGKLKVYKGFTDELKESFSDEPKDVQAKKIRKKRDNLIKEVSDLDLERKLREGKKGMGLDQAHRLSLKQVKKTNELYNVLNLGIDAPDINREIIQSYEDDLSKLYSKQNSIVKQAEKFDKVPKNISLELSKINKQISDVVAKTKGRLQGVHIDEFTLKPKTTGVNYINSIGMGLIDKDVKNLNQADLDLAKAIMPYQVENEKKIMKQVRNELIENKSQYGKNLVTQLAKKNNLSPELVKEELSNVQKVIRKMQGQMNSGMDPKLLTEYLGAEMKDLAAFGSKYGGDALSKVGKGVTGIDLPIFQVMFGSMYDIEQDSPLWLTLPAAFTDEVSNVFKLYDKSKGRFGLGKAKDFGKFLASSFVPRVLRNPIFKGVSKIGKAGSLATPVLELGKQVYLNEKRKGMLPDIARQFDIPIEKAREGYDNYIKQGQIRAMDSMVDDMEIPEISKQGQDNLDSTINSFKQIGALLGLNKDPYVEKESIYTRGKETPMSLDRVLYPDRQNFRDGTKLLKIANAGKKGLDYLKDFLKKKTITVKRGESGTEGASSSFSDPDYKGKYYTPEGGGFGTAAEDARYYSKLGGDEGSPKVFTAELTPEEIKEGLRLRSLDSQDPEIGDIILPESAEDKVKIDYLNTIRAKFEKYFNMAEGGRVNFADGPKDPSKKGIGSLSKRNFLKMLTLIPAGILALRGGPNLIKKVQKTAPVVKENLAGAPDHFWKIYNKIKEFGFDATKMYSFGPKDTKKYIKYKDYELTEDINTGEKTIQRMKPLDDDSASYYGNPLVEETYMSYRPGKGQMDETMKGKTPPDDYEEGTAYLRTDREYAGEVVDEMSGIADDIFEEAGVPVPEAIRKK